MRVSPTDAYYSKKSPATAAGPLQPVSGSQQPAVHLPLPSNDIVLPLSGM